MKKASVPANENYENEIHYLKERIKAQQDMLELTTNYLNRLRLQLQKKSDEINAGMRYAESFQDALAPTFKELNNHFSDSFVWLNQRDIIGGDLPYLFMDDDNIYVAAIDCVGHGVPGALLTMTAHTVLNQVIKDSKNCSPEEVIMKLNETMLKSSNYSDKKIYDGMDLALICYNKKENLLRYAGARRPLIFINERKERIIKGSRTSVKETHEMIVEEHAIDIEKGTWLYLFSDGITDQFDAKSLKKYGLSKLFESLKQSYKLDGYTQKRKLKESLTQWQADTDQTDDMLIIGLKI